MTNHMEYEAYLPWDKALKQKDATIWIFVVPRGESRKNYVSRRQPGICIITQSPEKFFTGKSRGLGEARLAIK